MKFKCISVALFTCMAWSCGNDKSSEATKDSANTLQDTFPASGFNDSMPADSNPADATRVDSIQKVPK